MAASGVMGPQIVVAPDICLRLAAQRERLGRIDERPIVGFAINQAMVRTAVRKSTTVAAG